MLQFAKKEGSEDQALCHTYSFDFFIMHINPEILLLMWCLTFCCDARIQRVVKVTPLLTFVQVSTLICCTSFKKKFKIIVI